MSLQSLIDIPELNFGVDGACGYELELRWVGDTVELFRAWDKWALEAPKTQIQSVNLISGTDCEDIGSVLIVYHVTAELRDADLEVSPVLCM